MACRSLTTGISYNDSQYRYIIPTAIILNARTHVCIKFNVNTIRIFNFWKIWKMILFYFFFCCPSIVPYVHRIASHRHTTISYHSGYFCTRKKCFNTIGLFTGFLCNFGHLSIASSKRKSDISFSACQHINNIEIGFHQLQVLRFNGRQ